MLVVPLCCLNGSSTVERALNNNNLWQKPESGFDKATKLQTYG